MTVYVMFLRSVLLHRGVECQGAGGEAVPGEGDPPSHREASTSQTRGQGGPGGRGEDIITDVTIIT